MKKKKEIIYLVEWQDAHSNGGWHQDHEVKEFIEKERCVCINVGWILSETKDELVIASRKLRYRQEGESEWGMLEKIPKAWIRKRIIFKGIL